ncbi:hypothetical protein Ccrd_020243 [Cynara cardunculus var. scolymus]|uniref:Uncharacterized protein n=1 Tax=Cynara cardunculus var. scolymus TaxID=59895 RepID=A0A118K0I9_CYNCS|nr:hypothetical protein Ccrd_020243 [Cynara cardunculus var. scolymus]
MEEIDMISKAATRIVAARSGWYLDSGATVHNVPPKVSGLGFCSLVPYFERIFHDFISSAYSGWDRVESWVIVYSVVWSSHRFGIASFKW